MSRKHSELMGSSERDMYENFSSVQSLTENNRYNGLNYLPPTPGGRLSASRNYSEKLNACIIMSESYYQL